MKDKERWMELCERAATEQDPAKLMELVTEIDNLLKEKQRRLNAKREQERNERNTFYRST